jgi:formylglycine-generating enzyme required for sulfatase activity
MRLSGEAVRNLRATNSRFGKPSQFNHKLGHFYFLSAKRSSRRLGLHLTILALLALCMNCGVAGAREYLRTAKDDSRPIVPAAQNSRQSAPDIFDCPFLPGCPGGTPVPLPPLPKLESKPSAPAPSSNGNGLVEGTGKHSGMVLIPTGPFDMGSAQGEGRLDERPIHKVFLKDFYIAKHNVTAKDFCAFLNAQGETSRDGLPRVRLDSPDCPIVKVGKAFKPKQDCSDKPMVCVSWYGASDYAEWVGGRLLSSAEWEKAALLITSYHAGDYTTILSREGAVPVNIAVPGAKGVTGMTGNIWEWCSDWYSKDYYSESPVSNPLGPALGEEKNIRGGSWASAECSKRTRNRHKASPRGYYRTVGFRIAKD